MTDGPTEPTLPAPEPDVPAAAEPALPASEPEVPAGALPVPSIVYLEVDDEITSAAARLRTMAAERIALVLPYGSRLATSRINFRLLAREAAANGKRLDIVAPDASARALAGSAGLAVHASVAALEADAPGSGGAGVAAARANPDLADAAETRVLAVPRAGPASIPSVGRRRGGVGGRRVAIVAVLLVALVAGAGYAAFTLLPSATIVVTPATQALGPLQLTVQARPDVTAPDPVNATVPAVVYDFPLSATQTFHSTGTKVVDTKAAGDVTFANFDTGGGVTIPAGSLVRTDGGIEFTTLGDVSLPRASFDFFPPFNLHPSTGSVAVRAVDSGPTGNVGANTITVIPPGYNKKNLHVTNPDPTAGGAHDESPQVSQQDVDEALAALNQALASQLDAAIAARTGVPSGTELFEVTRSVGETTPSVDPKTLVGTAGKDFDLGLMATGTALGVDPTPVATLAGPRLTSQVGQGWQLVPGSTHVDVGQPTAGGGVVSFPVTATATEVRVVDHDALVQAIRGLVLAQARSRLEAYGVTQISLWPDWVSTIPTDTSRISLTIAQPATSPGPSGLPVGSGGSGGSGSGGLEASATPPASPAGSATGSTPPSP